MAGKTEWLVILPDAEGALSKRMELRPEHLKRVTEGAKGGTITMGGITLTEAFKDGVPPPISGSAMVCLAESKEEVLEELKKDLYFQHGVWDTDKIQIMHFKTVTRAPFP